MTFHSILFATAKDSERKDAAEAPAFFVDLHLDQLVEAVTAGRADYNLKPFFYFPLRSVEAVRYRQQAMQDLQISALRESVDFFAVKMRAMRAHLTQANKLYYKLQKQSWFVDAVELYCDAVRRLVKELCSMDLKSEGFSGLRDYLTGYTSSDLFESLVAETAKTKADLATVRYAVLIKGDRVTVRKYEGEVDYSAEVEETFEKFKQGAVRDYRVKFSADPEMNHIEARVLDLVSQLYPEVFSSLEDYCAKNANYLDETVSVFDREVQFYLAYLEFVARLERTGLKFCYPEVSDEDKEVFDYEGFDAALAIKLTKQNSPVVCNDFYLKGAERIFVVSGPNQGGKTTFARTFGQLHYVAALGCSVPGREARLFLFDGLFTHFEREENIKDLRGKLEDDLFRIHAILEQARPNSVVIINEIFTSTTAKDALFLIRKVVEKIMALDSLCVCVTFIDELASLSEKTVSVVSTVVPQNPNVRTFKVVRRPADGLAYALSLAEKHRLTYACLKERVQL